MSAPSCTARWRKEEPGWTVRPAAAALRANSGCAKSQAMSASLSSPSMEPALWETMVLSPKGADSSPPRATMLQR